MIKRGKIILWAVIILVAIIFSSAVVYSVKTYFYFKAHPEAAFALLNQHPSADPPVQQDALISVMSPQFGAEEPLINIVEFGDFRCPQCQKAFFVLRPLLIKYKDEARFYWLDLPIVTEQSLDFALAGRCADAQGKFVEFHDRLFQFQDQLLPGNLVGIAQQVGLNSFQFAKCLDSSEKLNLIKTDVALADQLQVQGTPTVFLNQYKVQGAAPTETYEQIIQEILQEYEGSEK